MSSPAGTQLRIVHEIRSAGGFVGISPPPPGGWFGAITSRLPDAFGQIQAVRLADVRVRRDWLRGLRNSKQLTHLWLNRASVEDASMRHVAEYTGLVGLYLNGNPITDQGLQALKTMPRLEHLELNWTRITQLSDINRQFPRMRTLKLRGLRISDEVVTRLATLHGLKVLDVSRTPITDAGVRSLSHLNQPFSIDLSDTPTSLDAAYELQRGFSNCAVRARDRRYVTGRNSNP